MEKQVIKGQTLQGCHYFFMGFRALKIHYWHVKGLHFETVNARNVLEKTQQTLLPNINYLQSSLD